MSKASRELALIRSRKLKLIQFLQVDGDAVYVNPDEVANVEQTAVNRTMVHMKNGRSYTVALAHADVVGKLSE